MLGEDDPILRRPRERPLLDEILLVWFVLFGVVWVAAALVVLVVALSYVF